MVRGRSAIECSIATVCRVLRSLWPAVGQVDVDGNCEFGWQGALDSRGANIYSRYKLTGLLRWV